MSASLLEMPKVNQPEPVEEPIKYARGKNPASKSGLTSHKGRPKVRDVWGEDAKNLCTSCTPTAKEGISDSLEASGYDSLAELLEYIGRGLITLPQKPKRPEL
jgi:hypothetical protein